MREWMGRSCKGPGCIGNAPPANGENLIGIAAPHVSPAGGYESYRAAYRLLGPRYKERTFVILGTSHYGDARKLRGLPASLT